MATAHPIPEPALKALAWLLDLAAQRAGFTIHGLPGWASADEIKVGARTWGTSEMMRAQARKGRVHEFDARARGERRPRWIYRISQHGIAEMARTLGVNAASVRDPLLGEEPGTLVRESTQYVIAALRKALNPEVKPVREWVPGETGWRSSRELTTQMAREDEESGMPSYRWFTTEDLRWLVRLGFVEERVVVRTHIYRLLPAGEALQPLEWRKPRG